MLQGINPVDSIVVQLNNSRAGHHEDPDKLVKSQNNTVQLNLDISEDTLVRAVENVNKNYLAENERMEYDYHDQTNTFIIRIIDQKTNEVIKQIPSQKLLDYASGLMEYIGIFADTKV